MLLQLRREAKGRGARGELLVRSSSRMLTWISLNELVTVVLLGELFFPLFLSFLTVYEFDSRLRLVVHVVEF